MVERCWLDGLVEYSFVVLVLLKSSQEAQSAQQLGSSALKNEYSYTQLKLRQLWNQCRGSSQQLRGATTSFFSALLLLLPQLKRLRLKLWIAVSRSFATFFKVFWSCSSSASPTWSCRCCCRSTRPRPRAQRCCCFRVVASCFSCRRGVHQPTPFQLQKPNFQTRQTIVSRVGLAAKVNESSKL